MKLRSLNNLSGRNFLIVSNNNKNPKLFSLFKEIFPDFEGENLLQAVSPFGIIFNQEVLLPPFYQRKQFIREKTLSMKNAS